MKTTTPVSIVCASALAVAGLTAYATAQAPSPSSREASAWKQVSYLKASNPGEGDEFGHTTALSADGSTLAVGAKMESSGATGINGRQNDDSAFSTGAVYVYARSGDRWRSRLMSRLRIPGRMISSDSAWP